MDDLWRIRKIFTLPIQKLVVQIRGGNHMLGNIIALYTFSASAVVAAAAPVVQPPAMVFEACQVVQTPDNPHEWELTNHRPADLIGVYHNNIRLPEPDISKAKVRVVREAKNGKISPVSEDRVKKMAGGLLGGPVFSYLPRKGYRGPDEVTFLVTLDGKNYEIRDKFYVVWQISDDDWYEKGTPATQCAEFGYRRIR